MSCHNIFYKEIQDLSKNEQIHDQTFPVYHKRHMVQYGIVSELEIDNQILTVSKKPNIFMEESAEGKTVKKVLRQL